MPVIDRKVGRRLCLSLVLAVALFGFTPISHALLRSVDGSFNPSPFTSLALRTPSEAITGVTRGEPVKVELTNRSGRAKTYRWQASQAGTLIGIGLERLANDQTETILIPTNHAASGRLRIAIDGTGIYVAVPIVTS